MPILSRLKQVLRSLLQHPEWQPGVVIAQGHYAPIEISQPTNKNNDAIMLASPRELDKLVAEHVMGWKWDEFTAWRPKKVSPYSRHMGVGKTDPWYWLPYYSSDMTSAWEVVDEMRAKDYQVTTKSWASISEHQCCFHIVKGEVGNAPCSIQRTMPIAICVAALRIVGIEVDVLLDENI